MNILHLELGESVPDGFTGVAISALNTKTWYKNGKCHREDAPAVEWSDGTKIWFKEGKRHRVDGPAIEYADGLNYWYLDGYSYMSQDLDYIIDKTSFLGKEKGKYDLEWLRFFTEEGVKEFPLIPGILDRLESSDTKLYKKIKDLNDNKT